MKRRRNRISLPSSSSSSVYFCSFLFLLGAVDCIQQPKPVYDGKALSVPINDEGAVDLVTHWTDQAYSGLFAAVAAKKLNQVPKNIQDELTKCSKASKDSYQHAACVSSLLNHANQEPRQFDQQQQQQLKAADFDAYLRRAASGFMDLDGAVEATTAAYTQTPTTTRGHRRSSKAPAAVHSKGAFTVLDDSGSEEENVPISQAFVQREKRGLHFEDNKGDQIVSRDNYGIRRANEGLSPLGMVARMMLKSILVEKNKTQPATWQSAVHRIKHVNHARKKAEKEGKLKKTKMPFDPESKIDMLEQFAHRALAENGQFGDMDPENPEHMKKLAHDERLKNGDPMRRLMNLLRDGVKLGYNMAGKNTTNFDDKTLKVASPRFLSVVPETDSDDIVDIISPSLFSLHNEGEGLEKLTSLPSLMKTFNGADQQQWMDLIIEAAGVDDQAKKMEDELKKKHDQPKVDVKDFKGVDGQPMFFTKENVTERYGQKEGHKIETFETLIGSYTKEQLREMNSTGFAVMSDEQLELLYGTKSPFNNTDVLQKMKSLNSSDIMSLIEQDVHLFGKYGTHRRNKRAIILSPLINFPIIFAAPILSQAVILSPLVFSPIVGTPAVLGPIILSPWVFIPLILSPRVLSPLILTPMIFSPIVLSPLVLHPLILCPGIFNPIVLSPLVLSPLILSPQVFTPIVLSPLVLNPLILNPMVGSPLVLSPFVLSPLILSPQALFAVVLSPYALSPLILSPLALAEVILSPSWLS